MTGPTAADCSAALRHDRANWLPRLFPAGKVARGMFFIGDADGAEGDSFPIPLTANRAEELRDFGGDFRGDDLDLYARGRRLDLCDAITEVARIYGFGERHAGLAQPKRAANTNDDVRSLPMQEGKPVPPHPQLGAPTHVWPYYDAMNRLVMWHARFDEEVNGRPKLDGRGKRSKQFRPLINTTAGLRWNWPTPIPLYRLPDVLANPDAPVLIVEGEKTADAAREIIAGYVVAAWAGGSAGIDRADWSPLKGRRVTIWPDADRSGAGRVAGEKIAQHATGAGARSIRIVEPPADLPDTWDLADPLPEAWTDADVLRMIEQAQPVKVAGDAQRGRLDLVWFEDIEPDLDASAIVEDVLTPNALSVVYGESNCGKTFFATDLALHVALGWRWRDRHVIQGAVIYVAAEGGRGILNRIAAFRRHHGITDPIPFAALRSSVNLLDPDAHAAELVNLITAAAAHAGMSVSLVVIDTLSRAMAGGNENSSEDMGALVMNADRIRQETGAHLMFIHHSGKDSAKGARGHSLLRAATDTEIEVKRDNDGGPSTAKVMKQRDLETVGDFPFSLHKVELGTNSLGKPVTSCIITPTDAAPATAGAPARAGGKSKEPPPAAQRYHDALLSAIIDHGTAWKGKRSVTLEQWEAECIRRGLLEEGDEREVRRRRSTAFSKNRVKLIEHGWATCDGNRVWSARPVTE